jgi:diaminopimelate decarboxylase
MFFFIDFKRRRTSLAEKKTLTINHTDIGTEYIDTVLYYGGINLEELLSKIRTPAFIFSQKILKDQYNTLEHSFSSIDAKEIRIAFSTKSNPLKEVYNTFIQKNSFFEVTSIGEMKQILDLEGSSSKIIFTNIVKTDEALLYAAENKIGLIAIDSWSDMLNVERIYQTLRKRCKIIIRVNPLTTLNNTIFACTGINSKIGIKIPNSMDENSLFSNILDYCMNSDYLTFEGIHVHLGSQITNIHEYQEGMKKISDLINQLNNIGIDIEILDIGGGFPIDYGIENIPDMDEFSSIIKNTFKTQLKSTVLIIESGRYLTGPAGILALKISILKTDPKGSNIACVDGSFYNTIPDVIIADWPFPLKKVKINENVSTEEYQIVGASNDTLDRYNDQNDPQKLVKIQKLEEGEFIIFLQAGAYSVSFNSTYCMEKRPEIFFIYDK